MINDDNKKIRQILTTGILIMFLATFFSGIVGAFNSEYELAPSAESDGDWDHWTKAPHMFAIPEGNIGIGTTTPSSKFHVENGSVLFNGTVGGIPILGAGTRFMWIPEKAAFRAGKVGGSQWDESNIGLRSVAFGENTIASAIASTAIGTGTIASGRNSFASGKETNASARASTAMGKGTAAHGQYSMAFGSDITVEGHRSIGIGVGSAPYTITDNDVLSIMGGNVGIGTTSPNSLLEVNGIIHSTSGGFMFPDGTIQETAVDITGSGLDQAYDQGGPGAGRTINADAGAVDISGPDGLIVNGTVGIGTTNPESKLDVTDGAVLFQGSSGSTPISGMGKRFMWIPHRAALRAGSVSGEYWDEYYIGSHSAAFGRDTRARGYCSIATGFETQATGDSSVAMGEGTLAAGYCAFAAGYNTKANRYYSTAMGYETSAGGFYSTALGHKTIADGAASTAMGMHTKADQLCAVAMGRDSIAYGFAATAMGVHANAGNRAAVAMGQDTVSTGWASTAMGYKTKAKNNFATAIGTAITVKGDSSVGIGLGFKTPPYLVEADHVMSIMGGNVGIGTTNPAQTLHIDDVMRLEPLSTFPTEVGDGDLCVKGTPGDYHIYCYLNGNWRQLD